eukprot:TRINITY_DN21779_c0_g1_i1.p1 TRINITY_DN21779_c0_g1~~TRINITY_DN21779_c0_g1_i1.p1  ORF type:complete len:300 (+),score=45.42 TRINITY_DN21779_c0_g1_i1:21-920(+)
MKLVSSFPLSTINKLSAPVPAPTPAPVSYKERVNQTRSWLAVLDQHKVPINLEGLWAANSDGYLWQHLNIVPKDDSESRYDYSVWYGSGACLATNIGLFHARLDHLSGLLKATPRAKLASNHQLLALFDGPAREYWDTDLHQIVALPPPPPEPTPARYIPLPSSLFLVSSTNAEQWWGRPYDYESMQWYPRDQERHPSLAPPPAPHPRPDLLQHRYLFHPQTLSPWVGVEEVEGLFPGDESFVEMYRYVFRTSHGDMVTPYLPAKEIVERFRGWIPRSVQERLAKGRNKTVAGLLTSPL